MKLVNARGMDESLMIFKERCCAEGEMLYKKIKISNFITENAGKEIDEFKIEVDKENFVINKKSSILGKEFWKKQFKTKNIDNVLSKFASELYGKEFNVYKTTLSEKKEDSFLTDIDKNWKEKSKDFAESFYVSMLNLDSGMQHYNDIFQKQFALLFEYAKNFKNRKNCFVYNDADNGFYMPKKNEVVLYNQNFKYKIVFEKDSYNVVVDEGLGNDKLEADFSFQVSDEPRLLFNELPKPWVLSHFMLDLGFAIECYEMDYEVKKEVNPIIKTYNYLLAYNHHNFNVSKEESIWRIFFYGFPKGVDNLGNLIVDDREELPYQKKVELLSETIDNVITHNEFKVLVDYKNNKVFKKIKEVNDDWKKAFKDAFDLVSEFLEKYKEADDVKKKELSFADNPNELINDLEEFLEHAKRLSSEKPKLKIK